MSEDVSAGRLSMEAYVDTTGLSRGLQQRVDAETRNIRAKIRAELDNRTIAASAKKAAVEASRTAKVTLQADVDTSGLIDKVRRAAAEASRTAKVTLKVDVDQSSVAGANRAVDRMRKYNRLSVNVDADTTRATEEIDAERRRQESNPINVPVRADTSKLKTTGRELAQFSKIPAIIGGVYTLGAAVVQLAGGLFSVASAGASAVGVLGVLPSLAATAVQGIGSLVIGFTGIGDAVGALSKQQTTAAADAKTGADAQVAAARRITDARYALRQSIHQQADDEKAAARTIAAARDSVRQAIDAQKQGAIDAARSIRDAQRGVADALLQQADDARNSAQTIANAEYNLAQAHTAVRDAQLGLTQARKDARDEIARLNQELRLSAGDEASALAAVKKAREDLQDVNWDKAASEQERRDARIALMEAENNFDRVKARRKDIAKQAADANRRGVEGSPQVQGAKDTLSGALHNQQQATISLADARRNAAEQEVADARAVQTAREALARAQHDADAREQADAKAVKDARAALAQTRHDTDDQARADAHAVAMAQRELGDAQKAATDAAVKQSTAQTAVNTAMEHLSPAGRRFARFLIGLLPRVYAFRNAVQTALLPPIQRGIEAALPLLDTLQHGFVVSARTVGNFGERLGRLFGSAAFNTDIAGIMRVNNRALSIFVDALFSLVQAVTDVTAVAGPHLLVPFARWVRTLALAAAGAADTGRKTGKMGDFFDRARATASTLADIVWNLTRLLWGVGAASQDSGHRMLGDFSTALDKWADWANSDAGQKRMREFFDAVEPVTRAVGKLATSLGALIVSLGGSDSTPLMAFIGTLQFFVDVLNRASQGRGGVVIGWLMEIIGVAGALGFVSGQVLKLAGSFQKINTVVGGLRKVTGLNALGRMVRDIGKDAEGQGGVWQRLGTRVREFGGRVGRAARDMARTGWQRFTNGARRAGAALWDATKAAGRYVLMGARVIGSLIRQAAMWTIQRARMLAARAAMLAVRAAVIVWTAAQWLFNAAMAANPLGLAIIAIFAIGAALVWAYKRFSGFRKVVDTVFGAIVKAAQWLWRTLFGGSIFPDMIRAFRKWRDRVAGFFQAVADKFVAVGKALRKAATAVITWFRRNWPVILAILTGPMGLATLFIVKHWNQIRDKIRDVWNKVIRGIFGNMRAGVLLVRNKFGDARKGIVNHLEAIRDKVRDVWRNVISGVFDKMKKGVGLVKDAFATARKGIGTAWGKVEGAVRGPVRAVLRLINTWVIDKFNALSRKVGGPTLDRINMARFSEGGTVEGHSPHSKADNIPAMLTAGERVTRQWAAQQMDRHFPGFMDYVNRHGRPPGYAEGGPVRVQHGTVAAELRTTQPKRFTNPSKRMTMDGKAVSRIAAAQLALAEKIGRVNFHIMQGGFGGSHIRASGSSHNYPGVVDVGPASIRLETLLRRVGFAAWARNIRGRSSVGSGQHIHAVSLLDPGDRRSPQVYGSWANHGNGLAGANNDPAGHPPWIPNLLQRLGAVNLSSIASGGGGIGSWLDTIVGKMRGWLAAPFDYLKGVIDKPVQALRDRFPGNAMAGMLARLPGKLVGSAADKIKELVGIKEKNYQSNFGGVLGGAVGGITANIGRVAGAMKYLPTIRQALNLLGQPARYAGNVMQRLIKESGGRARAINLWDSNAMRGTPSVGLMQVIKGTYQAYAGRFRRQGPFLRGVSVNPLANIYAGLNYAIHRYGRSWPRVMLRSGGYDGGGPLYPGSTLAVNQTGKTETVFTNENMVDLAGHLATAAQALQSLIVPTGTGGLPPLVGELTLQAREDQMPALLQDVTHELRVIRMGGVHVRRTP